MARERVFDSQNVCNLCYCPTEAFGRMKHRLWRCINPLCRNSKEGEGMIAEEKRINKSRFTILIDGEEI